MTAPGPELEATPGGATPDAALAAEVVDLVKAFVSPRGFGALVRHPLTPKRVPALAGVSLRVPAGSVVGLIGPNGAGKTTLIKILAGMVRPDAGAVRVLGRPVGDATGRARVGLVTADERSFYWRVSARENLRFFASLHGLARADARARIDALAERLDLGAVLGRPFRELSSGNRGRLALARGLLHQPRLLLLDEPARALDPGAARRLRRLLRGLVEDDGLGALYATHDLAEVRRACDTVVLLDHGRVLADGPFEQVEPVARQTFDIEDEDLLG